MRLIPLIPAALIVSLSQPALCPGLDALRQPEDGFSANYPGQPKVETTTYPLNIGQTLPAQGLQGRGRARTLLHHGRRLPGHREAAHRSGGEVPAAKGANQQDGDTCQNDFRLDLAGATDHAVWNFIKRDGVKMTNYMYLLRRARVGPAAADDEPGQSRTYAAIHQHAGRLYIHRRRSLRDAGADPLHAVAGMGRREGTRHSLSDDLHGGIRRMDVSAPAAAVTRSGTSLRRSMERPPGALNRDGR